MSPILIYFIETLLCSGLFLLLYHWFIARRAGYGFCRKYLIVTMVLASVIPMLNVPLYPPLNTDSKVAVVSEPEKVETVGTVAETTSAVSSEPVSAQASEVSAPAPEVSAPTEVAIVEQAQASPVAVSNVQPVYDFIRSNALLIIYLTGVAVSLLAIAGGAVSVARIRRKSHITQARSFDLAESEGVETPFSFLHTIYIGYGYDEKDRCHILSHEASHVRHHHSIEKLFMSLMRSLFWFNPLMWLAEKCLEDVQEWQADKDALSDGYRLDEYRQTVVNQLFGYNPEMVSGLRSSFTKRRLLKMKQTEYKGGIGLQVCATSLVAAVLFLAFGCGRAKTADAQPNTPVDYEDLYNTKNYIMTADEFLGDFSGTRTRTASYVFERDEQGRVIKGVEIYENKDYTIAPVTIAVNGVERAKSPRDRKLRWINKSTVIIIGGKKSTRADFLALKEGEYEKIYYFRPKGEKADECSFVYVSTPEHQVAPYNYPVIIDNPGFDAPDIIDPKGESFYEEMFLYQAVNYSVATPDAKFVLDGNFVSYDVFQKYLVNPENKIPNLLVYRNDAARKFFGDDCWEVVECSNRKNVFIWFDRLHGDKVVPQLGRNGKESSYQDIIDAIAAAKEYNKTIGGPTLVDLRVQKDVTDSQVKELIDNCIDADDPDVYLYMQRTRQIISEDGNGNRTVRSVYDDNTDNLIEHGYVDLGLSVKWATCNVGASQPEDYGGYYAWGETAIKNNYVWNTYRYRNGVTGPFTKYNSERGKGTVDHKTVLEPDDDVAHVRWGGDWRIPTKDELEELLNNCTWTWTTLNGVNGYQVTSNKSGYTDRSIFLPAAGRYLAEMKNETGTRVCIATSTQCAEDADGAYMLYFSQDEREIKPGYREYGVPVRPVMP